MANILPPPPVNDSPGSYTWLEWYRQLRTYVSTSGSVPWYIINFSGSNITDIAARDHGNLQGLQGGTAGERYHLTAAQASSLGAGAHNSLTSIQGGNSTERYHLTAQQYAGISNHCDIQSTTSGIVLATTPTLLKPITTVNASGIVYDNTTGEYTFSYGGSYTLNLSLNATPSGLNRILYFYAEENTGSGWVIRRYSARYRRLPVLSDEQTVFTASVYMAAGTKTRHYVWCNTATVTLDSVDLDGTVAGTVTAPAIRVSWEGGL